ncbi:dipeptide ABC transporter (ATP-binding subunit) [Candidatus Hydrogenisulfobacillus filiaventi]|uniref:Dipeptide ABC transporter (ATP-binding subunit) n=1 Tax=Candidatus Hydrogenisulfobacillus filiaventi TaxID=2707344 RepID=A0A6F8ZI34_9FIRM|nr:dipeptide ABC transporter (ATP-binding subunit) [Candidatus Hydrogenisulfobacillus filiaventi]
MGAETVLEVQDLVATFPGPSGRVAVVDGVSFHLRAGEVLALVGESGAGKSTLALALLRLLPEPPARIEQGVVAFRGRDLLRLDRRALRQVRGRQAAVIFQDPLSALNPAYRAGDQVAEMLRVHGRLGRRAASGRAVALLEEAGLPDARAVAVRYPHQLSGGMRQRVLIAMALACRPRLLIADEPTAALDVTVQAGILALFRRVAEGGTAVLFISHDLGVVAQVADRIGVLYAGRLVETGPAGLLLRDPRHPYTQALLAAVPRPDGPRPGASPPLPDPGPPAGGCAFAPRCPRAGPRCRAVPPPAFAAGPGRTVRCWAAGGEEGRR